MALMERRVRESIALKISQSRAIKELAREEAESAAEERRINYSEIVQRALDRDPDVARKIAEIKEREGVSAP